MQEWVWGIAITPDGKRAISGSSDRSVRLWDLDQGKELAKCEGHTDFVNGVWSPLSRRRHRRSVVVHGLRRCTRQPKMPQIERTTSICMAGVGISADGNVGVSGSRDKQVRIWDLEKGSTRHTLTGTPLCGRPAAPPAHPPTCPVLSRPACLTCLHVARPTCPAHAARPSVMPASSFALARRCRPHAHTSER